MFEDLIRDVQKIHVPMVHDGPTDVSQIPAINYDVFMQKLTELDKISEKDLYELLRSGYKRFLYELLSTSDCSFYLSVFVNPKFINVLTQVLSRVQLEPSEIVACNKIAYDYMTLGNTDPYVKELMFIMAKTINRMTIQNLLTLGLQENFAAYIALSRRSDTNEKTNVKRVNFTMMVNGSPQIMTPQTIVNVYEKLFDSVQFLFPATMFDTLDEEAGWVTDSISEVYSNISYAVLVIINTLPFHSIKKVLGNYTDEFRMMYGGNPRVLRFSMRTLSSDFARIKTAIEDLEQSGIYVP